MMSYLCSTWTCLFDLFLSLMVFHIWGHFNILIQKLKDFPTPKHKLQMTLDDGTTLSAEKYSKDECLQVLDNLKECIDYHRGIKM